MLQEIINNITLIRNGMVLVGLLFLFILFVVKKQDETQNWSLFFSALWVAFLLGVCNYLCVEYRLWTFTDEQETFIRMPYDLYFVWILLWGILPFYLAKGKYMGIIALLLFWLDLVLMPELETIGILVLHNQWIWGEVLMVTVVWIPAYLWAKYYTNKTNRAIRAFFQVLIMTIFLLVFLPSFILNFQGKPFTSVITNGVMMQIMFICAFPALAAVNNLVYLGEGTPFPYDKTKRLVQSGVYAYCKNPIQWSFTLIFIPLSLYHHSLLLAMGTVLSIAYVVGVSLNQEQSDMTTRFGQEWTTYSKQTPSWYFLWKPKAIPKATIYFQQDCQSCEQVKHWFNSRDLVHLNTKYAHEFKGNTLLKVTYQDKEGNCYNGVQAIAMGLEHINLAYASLGWFMQLPGVLQLLTHVVNSTGIYNQNAQCASKDE